MYSVFCWQMVMYFATPAVNLSVLLVLLLPLVFAETLSL